MIVAKIDSSRTCGQAYGTLSAAGHPCARSVNHYFDDKLGHVCRCEAEKFLEQHAPCNLKRGRA